MSVAAPASYMGPRNVNSGSLAAQKILLLEPVLPLVIFKCCLNGYLTYKSAVCCNIFEPMWTVEHLLFPIFAKVTKTILLMKINMC